MALTLTQLIAQVQALFIDDGTLFPADLCTAALRQALKDFNQAAPVHSGEVVAVVSSLRCSRLQRDQASLIRDASSH